MKTWIRQLLTRGLATATAGVITVLLIAVGCANSTNTYLDEVRAGLITEEEFTAVEVSQIPDEYLLLVGTDICESLSQGLPPSGHERHVVLAAIEHLC